MTSWTTAELQTIGHAEEWIIRTMRADGSLRDSFPVWGVRVGDDLYIRAVRGRTSPWFQGMLTRHEGDVRAAGIAKDVVFVEVTDIGDEIDAQYEEKYRRYPSIVPTCLTEDARAATLKLVPREVHHPG